MKAGILIIPGIICAIAAAYMAINGLNGWGYFLFGAIFLTGAAT